MVDIIEGQGLGCIINRPAKRIITPRTQEFLKIHKDAYKIALDVEPSDKAALAVVQAMDTVYYSSAFYVKPRSSEEHEHLMYYVKLRRLEFLANYGNTSRCAIHSDVDSRIEFLSNEVPASEDGKRSCRLTNSSKSPPAHLPHDDNFRKPVRRMHRLE